MPHEEDRRTVDDQHHRGSQSGGVLGEPELFVNIRRHVGEKHVEGNGVEAGDSKGDEGLMQVVSQQQPQRLGPSPGMRESPPGAPGCSGR